MSTYPEKLIRGVFAAQVSSWSGISLKAAERYLPNALYKREPRTDEKTRVYCLTEIKRRLEHLSSVNQKLAEHLGRAVGDAGVSMAANAIENAFRLADIGNLFETTAVARQSIEQLAWSFAASQLEVAEEISALRAQSSISTLKTTLPKIGTLYGWLSEHAHWKFETHRQAIVTRDQRVLTVLRSVDYKVQSYCFLTLLSQYFCAHLDAIVRDRAADVELESNLGGFIDAYKQIVSAIGAQGNPETLLTALFFKDLLLADEAT